MTESEFDFVTRRDVPASPELRAGMELGRFRLLEHLGDGGMGSVWSAEDPSRRDEKRQGRVVLKFLREDIRRCAEAVDDFCTSYRRTQELTHTHICPLMDLGEDPVFGHFQVMRFIPGLTLQQWLRQKASRRRGLSVETTVQLLRPVAEALDYAAAEGIVHRDVKPGNIMLKLDGDRIVGVYVVDFGLAAEVRTSMSLHSRTSLGISGTEPYMAPEQWRGLAQDSKSDQYSLAVTAWQMLTGSLPYHGTGEQLSIIVKNEPIPELPNALAALQLTFDKAMAKERRERFDKIVDFIDALADPTIGNGPEGSSQQRTTAVDKASDDDLAGLLQRTQENVARRHAQARQLVVQQQDYAGALEILEQTPEHLRQSELYETASQSAVRVQELEASIRQAVKEVKLEGLREQVTELMQLQPQRVDMQRLLEQLPSEPVRPQRPEPLVAPFDAATARSAQQAWAKYLGVDVEITNSLGMKFRVIPPGTFLMGSPATEAKRSNYETQHEVRLTEPTLMGVYPVTQREWERVMGSNPSHFSQVSDSDASRHPVEEVSWEMCQDYVDRLNESFGISGLRYRLPTEAEWEYACRAGTGTPFSFGRTLNGTEANCNGNLPYGAKKGPHLKRTSAVGSYASNAFGLCDMHGNVCEWCEDWYGAYSAGACSEDPDGPSSGSSRVLRGGSWCSLAEDCRSAYRRYVEPADIHYYTGCRLLCAFV